MKLLTTIVPIIVVICYLVGELYKFIFRKKQELYKLIPLIMAIVGGAFGILIYATSNTLSFIDNIYDAILIGIVSGESATGTNQIIKQIFKKGE